MAGELQAEDATAQTLYDVLRDASGNAYRTDTAVWEAPDDAHRTNYAVDLAEAALLGSYRGNLPAGAAALATRALTYRRAGASPAAGDLLVWEQDLGSLALPRLLGLSGHNRGLRDLAWDGKNLLTATIYLYDTATHALLNDGVTGVTAQYAITNTYLDGRLATERRVEF